MTAAELGQQPALPKVFGTYDLMTGLTKREWFIGQAMAGCSAPVEEVVSRADQLLALLAAPQEAPVVKVDPWKMLEDKVEELQGLREHRDKLQAFKDWVHAYLDSHKVPHHPPGTHGAAGCRIGDRMDWLMNELRTARGMTLESIANLRPALRRMIHLATTAPLTAEQWEEVAAAEKLVEGKT
jgi:hypothetical protein